jgi:MFS family permease
MTFGISMSGNLSGNLITCQAMSRRREDLPEGVAGGGAARALRGRDPARGAAARALDGRAYRRFAAGALVSNVATWMLRLAQALLILDLTDGSGAALGAVAALQFLPLLALGPWIGVLADRHSKRALLRAAEAIMAVLAAVQGALILAGAVEVWHVYAITLLFGVGAALDFPLRIALVPEIVPPAAVADGVALNAVSVNLARLVGPALAGLLAAEGGLGVAFLLAALGFALFGALLRGPPGAFAAPATAAGPGQIREALRYVRRHRELLLVFVLVALGGIAGPNVLNLAALMATEVFGEGPATVGLYGTLMAGGALLGAVAVVRLRRPTLGVATGGALALGLLTVAAAVAPGAISFGALLTAAGFAAIVMVSTSMAFVQLAIDGPLRGRVTSLFSIVLLAGIPVASPPLGVVADLAGVRWSIGLAGALVAASALAVRQLAKAATSARSAADSRQPAAAALARTCSGRVAPAMTDATTGSDAR